MPKIFYLLLWFCLFVYFIDNFGDLIRDIVSHSQPYLGLDQGTVNTLTWGPVFWRILHSGLLKREKNLLWSLSGGLV